MSSAGDTELSSEQIQDRQLDTSNLRVGATDVDGDQIKMVYKVMDDYAIYITEHGVKHDSINPTTKTFSPIVTMVNDLNRYRKRYNFIDRDIAQAKVECLEGNPDRAQQILGQTNGRVGKLLEDENRFQYIFVCMIAAALPPLTAFLLSFSPLPSQYQFVGWIASCGGLGALLSVCIHMKRLEIDPASSNLMNAVSAVSRIVIGMIGAVFLFLAIKGNIIFGALNDVSNPSLLLATSIMAGFSETLVPNTLRHVEKQART